ncbi:MAG: PAS domain-containing protein [Phenylobacterium sp.]|uniref:PAS domain-containing protein n=1 Tax=Phenylobacterium sp. TaxID=1871053 RepID=UPI00391D5CC0
MIGRWAQRFTTSVENPVAGLAIALGAVAMAAGLRTASGMTGPGSPSFMFFFPAVLLATLVAGARGGLLVTAASTIFVAAFWIRDSAPAGLDSAAVLQLVLFPLSAAVTVLLATAIRIAVRRGVAAEERFRIFQEHALDAFVILEPLRERGEIADFVWSYANPAAERMAPAASGGLLGRKVRDLFPDETGEDMVARYMAVLAADGPDDVEVRRIIDGQERFFRSSAVRLADGVAVTFRDVTAQRRSENALREGEARVRALIDALPQLIWSNRPDGHCDYLSPQWIDYTGAPPERHLGWGWMEAVHPDDRDVVEAAWKQAVDGALPFDVEYRLRRADGAWRWFNGRASALRDETGAVRRWFGVSTDITEIVEARHNLEERVAERTRALEASLEERARAEAALTRAQRLETLGRLTGGVAHDFNNLLTVVIGGLDLILKHAADPGRVRRLAEAALAAGRRGERLTRQLLAFSRRQELSLEVVDLAALIEQIEPLLRRAVGESVELVVDCEAAPATSRIDPAQFEAALLNLVANAADALPGRTGRVEIALGRVRLAEDEVRGAAPGDYLRLAVTDDGEGMSPETLERAFEPFFTTKDVGAGTGLGLAQVYGFAGQVGGAAALRSAPGQGTTVSLYLPYAPEAARSEAVEAALDLPAARGARVLLVEDDAAVRAVTESMLTELGCQVVSAPDGRQALARLQSGESFDLLITDVVMPGGMSGVELARTARTRDPLMPIVLTTGYAGERLDEEPDGPAWPILRKPFRAEQLGAILRGALKARTPVAG